MTETLDVSRMRKNPELGAGETVVMLIKWTNQSYHDENLKSMFTGQWDEKADVSRANTNRHRQQYYPGLIATFDLSTDFLDRSSADYARDEVQPTDIDINPSSVALAAGNRILVRDTLEGSNKKSIENPWFARLHSVEQLGTNHFLTVSSSFDQIYVVDDTGNILQHLDVWAQGKNINKFGHAMLRDYGVIPGHKDRINPEVSLLKEPNDCPQRVNIISDPRTYKGLGLPTYLTPTFVNHVTYDRNEHKVLATTLNTGECLRMDLSTGTINTILSNLVKPHGLRKYKNGYMVTDSGREHILILDESFGVQKRYDISTLQERKPGLERALWLQNTTQLGGGLLATISAPRQRITLIDPEQNEYRDIPYDQDWGVQTIKSYPGS